MPRPRLHLIRFHGVVAPNARLRAQVVPQGPAGEGLAHEAPVVEGPATRDGDEQARARPARMGWAWLLTRVFDIDVRHCPICGSGQFKIIAAILDGAVIEKILRHLGLDPRLPPRAPARPVRPHAS